MSTFGFEERTILLKSPESTSVRPEAEFEGEGSIRDRFERALTAIEVLADWFTVALAVSGGYGLYHLLHLGRRVNYPLTTVAWISGAVALLYVILLDRDGAYRPGNSLLRIKETERSLRVSMQTFLLILPVTFFGNYLFSRGVFLVALLGVPLLQAIEKQLVFKAVGTLRSRNVGVKRVMIYGAGACGRRVLSALMRSPSLGLKPVAMVDDDPDLEGQEVFEYAYRRGQSVKVVAGPVTKELLRNHNCGMLVVAIPSLGRHRFTNAVNTAQAANVRLAYVPGQAIEGEYWTEYADIDGTLLSIFGKPAPDWQYEMLKRPFDVVAAVALIVVLSPVWLLLALLIRLDSPGPVLFRQQRVGKDGELFNLYKLRSMRVDAPKYAESPTDTYDPRITRLGRFLRRSSLDELAQLINVVKGDMSLVGPRPEMPFIVEKYTAAHRQRLRVKPGITGLWQLSADRAFQIHENIQYDLYYIRHRGMFMDFAILLHTLVFAMHGV
ncbi:MAG: exopolysaccharide biosynthesis polyprenyl glycosylphosphotransferase [Acidocella sp.]|nr:exopolysaccharide biosynthesis polyprenyl glycosylphosphotransferase [Acidocella sp.]